MSHVLHLKGFVLVVLLALTFGWPVDKRQVKACQWSCLTSNRQEGIILSCLWREGSQKYLVNSTKCLPQTLHMVDTVMHARNTKMNGVFLSPRKIKFHGNCFM